MFGVLKNNKKDVFYIFLLTCIFLACSIFLYAKAGYPFIDSARELWYPQLMLEGKLLYKDILNLYGPLSYQINALIYHFFGVKSNNLFNMGFFVSYLIMILSYVIARVFSRPYISFVATFLTFILMFRFIYTGFNFTTYNFPYSYAILYSLFFCLSILTCVLFFFKTEKKSLVFWASFFIGLDVITKFDFIGFDFFIICVLMFNKKLMLKDKFLSLMIMFLPAVFSFGTLFFQGVTFNDLSKSINFLIDFSKAPSVDIYNHYHMGMYFTKEHFLNSIHYFKLFFGYFVFYFIISLISVFLFDINKIFSLLFLVLSWKILIQDKWFISYMTDLDCLCFVPFIFFFVVYCLVYKFYIKKEPIDNNQKLFNFTAICALFLNIRYFWYVFINAGGNFSILLYFVLIVIFFIENAKTDFMKKSLSLFFILITSCFLFNSYQASKDYTYVFKNNKGIWIFNNPYGRLVQSSINFVYENTEPDDTVLMVPESPMLSWFTDRKSYTDMYSLIPHFIDTYGEQWIINKIKKDKPKVILISSGAHHPPFGDGWFGTLSGKKIFNFINNNYDYVKTEEFDSYSKIWDFNIKFYRLKQEE